MEGPSAAASSGGKAPKAFLRRGEGVEKRVFASRYRKAITPPPASTANSSSGGGISEPWGSSDVVASRRGSQQDLASNSHGVQPAQPNAWSWDGKATELASETQLLGVEQAPGDQPLGSGPIGSRFLRNSLQVAWASRQAEEELELEEFRALETQIKADVVGGTRPLRPDQGAQALPSSSTLVPSAPMRSYAAIHQHRPPQPGHGAPRGPGMGRPHAGWASPQSVSHQLYSDAAGPNMDDCDDECADGGLTFPGSEPRGSNDRTVAAAAWGQQQLSPGKPASAAGGRASGVATWGSDGADGGAPGTAKAGGGRGFDDADSWNDSSNFFGSGAGAGVRKGAAAAAFNGGRAAARGSAFFGGRTQSPGAAAPLNDPWAAPAGGEDAHGAFGGEGALDDCSGWNADQQQKVQPQAQLGGQKGSDEDRGPDQPFVRALFNKQQQRQPSHVGGGRGPGKGASGAGGRGKAAEPQGPSAAELERMQALEEQVASVASERSTLVRMRTELEKAANRLEQERQTWEKSRAEEQAKWEAQRDAEEAKLRRDRRVLEKQSKALLKLPNKKERTAMEAAEAALEAERREGRAREARHKLTVERLRRQLVELQERNQELREEVRWHEAQQLERGWGGPGAAAAGAGGSAKGGAPGAREPQPRPPPGRAVAVQTEPLAFLPPLEGGSAGATGAPDAPAGRPAASSGFGGPQRGDSREGTAGPTASGSRPKSAGFSTVAGGTGRLRGLQASGRGAAAGVGASQPALPTTWRAERASLRKSGGAEQRQASTWEMQGDDGLEEGEGDDADTGPAYYGQGSLHLQQQQEQQRRRPLGTQPDSPVSWQQGGQQAYDRYGLEEYEFDCEDDDAPEAEEDAEGLEEQGRQSAGARGTRGAGGGGDAGFGRGRGGGGGVPGAASPSSYSYTQNDDAEVLTDEGGGADGFSLESPSTMAWQQHQAFMAKMGLGQDDGLQRPPPQAGQGSQRNAAATTDPRQQGHQHPWGHPAGAPNEEDFNAQRPGTSGRVPPKQQSQQKGQQHQGGPAFAQMGGQAWRQGGAGPQAGAPQRPPEGPSPPWQAYSGQDPATGPGPGSEFQFPCDNGRKYTAQGPPGPGRSGVGAGQGGKAASSAFFGTGERPFSASKPGGQAGGAAFAAVATAAAGQGPHSTATGSGPGQGRPRPGLRDSIGDLDDVSQTLASLRMDRHVEAAAAAVAATNGGGGGGAGPTAFGAPGSARAPAYGTDPAATQQRPLWPGATEQEREGGGWAADAWAAASYGGPVREACRPQPAPGAPAWGSVPPQAPLENSGWGGRGGNGGPSGQSQHFQQGQQHQQTTTARQPPLDIQGQMPFQQHSAGYGGPQWSNGTAGAAAAGAASVAHSVSMQQQQQQQPQQQQQHPYGAHVRSSGPQPASMASGGISGGNGGGAAGGNVLVREVRHADGKTERLYNSGTRLVLFANGTRKVALQDGSSRVYFANGDIKWVMPSAADAAAAAARGPSSPAPTPPPPDVGVVHYYYAEVGTWHSTYGGEGGVEVFYFPSGQTEAHHPGHGKEILFPDGVLRVVTVDGEEVDVTWAQLSWAVQQPQPRVDDLGDDDL